MIFIRWIDNSVSNFMTLASTKNHGFPFTFNTFTFGKSYKAIKVSLKSAENGHVKE